MPKFIPQGIGNFVWALGALGVAPSEPLLAAIMVRTTHFAAALEPRLK